MSTDPFGAGMIFAGDFRISRPLSTGGMGVVYVAEQISTARERALKVMLPDLAQSPDFKRRFEQEARIGAQIDSEHVVEVVGAGIDAGSGAPWLAMELLHGKDLAAHLDATGPLDVHAASEMFEQLAHGVGAAHRKQIVHRDLKPENLFLAKARRAGGSFTLKILDFGIAKLLGQARTSRTSAMGTPLWMAPEQTQNGAVITPAADVWAIGLIAFRVLTGKMFWKSAGDPESTSMMILREMVMDPIPPASERAAELGGAVLPPGFDAWFARAVDRDASKRFADANEMQAALLGVLGSVSPNGDTAAATAVAPPVTEAFAGVESPAVAVAVAVTGHGVTEAALPSPPQAKTIAAPPVAPPTLSAVVAATPSIAPQKAPRSMAVAAGAVALAAAAVAGIVMAARSSSAPTLVSAPADVAAQPAPVTHSGIASGQASQVPPIAAATGTAATPVNSASASRTDQPVGSAQAALSKPGELALRPTPASPGQPPNAQPPTTQPQASPAAPAVPSEKNGCAKGSSCAEQGCKATKSCAAK